MTPFSLQQISIYDTGETELFARPYFANASGTLEGYLLDAWFTGNNTYDALFVDTIPNQKVCKSMEDCRSRHQEWRCYCGLLAATPRYPVGGRQMCKLDLPLRDRDASLQVRGRLTHGGVHCAA